MAKVQVNRKDYCMKCSKVLEPEFVGPHKELGHQVSEYVFGGYVQSDYVAPPKVEKKIERMRQSAGEYPEEYEN